LNDAFIILDEAQNTSAEQMKMFLTRLGFNSHMVVTGDASQVDLPRGTDSGLAQAIDFLGQIDEIAVVELKSSDVVRHNLVYKIVDAYDRYQPEPTRPQRSGRNRNRSVLLAAEVLKETQYDIEIQRIVELDELIYQRL